MAGKKVVMSKKVLFCASAFSHIINFHSGYLKTLRELNFVIHTAAGGIPETSTGFNLNFDKNKNKLKNIPVIFKLAGIIRREKYDILSTHATLAGFVGRLAVFFNKDITVFHTCHGYLFNDDRSLKSKIMIIIEKFLSHRTDLLFVMNQDDYNIAKKYKLCKNIKYINGMGFIPEKLSADYDDNIFEKYEIPEHKKYFLCVGEFSKRKSQRDIIYALKLIKDRKNFHVIFLGDGVLLEECKNLCETHRLWNVTFCGYISETAPFYKIADCVISASRTEGLPFNIIEALYFNKPVIASNVKGHKDLIKDNLNGYLFDYGDSEKLAGLIEKNLLNDNKPGASLDDKYLFENVKNEILEEYINAEKLYI